MQHTNVFSATDKHITSDRSFPSYHTYLKCHLLVSTSFRSALWSFTHCVLHILGNVDSLDLQLSSEDSKLDSPGEESATCVQFTDASESDLADVSVSMNVCTNS